MEQLLTIMLLITVSAFFSFDEISFAAARKIKLSALVAEGYRRAACIL